MVGFFISLIYVAVPYSARIYLYVIADPLMTIFGHCYFIISRRALTREGDYEMMPVCACVRVCVR